MHNSVLRIIPIGLILVMERPSITDLFRKGSASGLTNRKHQRLFQSLQWRQAYEHSPFYEYSLESGSTFRVQQIPNGELKGLGTGTFVWPAAHILAKYFERRFGVGGLTGKTLCDIGSGTGLTGVVAAALGGSVTFTDQACVLPLLSENLTSVLEAGLGVQADQLVVKEYDWDAKVSLSEKPFDFLIVSDCVLPKLYPIDILVEAVDFVLGEETVAFFSYEHRPYPQFDPRQEFQRLCRLKGLQVRVVPMTEHHPVYCAEDIEIWEVCRAGSHAAGQADSANRCIFSSWGEGKTSVPVQMDGLQLTIHQKPAQGIGGVLWPSSAVASRLIVGPQFANVLAALKRDDPRAPLRAIDLGAGCGLTTIALHRRGFEVVATDKASIIQLLQDNIDEYLKSLPEASDQPIKVVDFEWDKVSSNASTGIDSTQQFDLIVCSDCLYDSTSIEPLLHTLEMLTISESVVLLVNELRTALEEFLYLARRRPNFEVNFKEIEITNPDLELVRNTEEVKFAPPVRACIIKWKRI